MINIGNLLLVGNTGRLAKHRRENKCFPDGGGLFMHIQLLTVTRGALEADTLRFTIDQDRPVNLACVLSLCQNIQQPSNIRTRKRREFGILTYVVFPAPEAPIKATREPGLTKPKTLSNSCFFSPWNGT